MFNIITCHEIFIFTYIIFFQFPCVYICLGGILVTSYRSIVLGYLSIVVVYPGHFICYCSKYLNVISEQKCIGFS